MPAFLLRIDRCYPHLQNAALRAAQVFRLDRRAAEQVLSKGRETCFFSLGSFTRLCLRTELHAPSALTSLLLFVLGIIKLLPLKLSLQTLATFFTLFSSWGVPFPESSCAWLALRHFLRGTSSILWQHRPKKKKNHIFRHKAETSSSVTQQFCHHIFLSFFQRVAFVALCPCLKLFAKALCLSVAVRRH